MTIPVRTTDNYAMDMAIENPGFIYMTTPLNDAEKDIWAAFWQRRVVGRITQGNEGRWVVEILRGGRTYFFTDAHQTFTNALVDLQTFLPMALAGPSVPAAVPSRPA